MTENQLSNPLFIVLKALLACAVALSLDQLLGNPDHVSSTFVAVLCISPTVLIGLRNAWAQVLGSLVGGLWGTWAALLGLPFEVGVPLAVAASVASSFVLKISTGYPVAAFTALFVILVPRETPIATFETRLLALGIAGISSFLINAAVSAMLYRSIYHRRLHKLEHFVFNSLPAVLHGNRQLADSGFSLLATLQQQLRQTLQELSLRRAWKTHAEIERMLQRTQHLTYLLHLVWDLAYLHAEAGVALEESDGFLAWVRDPDSRPFPFLPDPLLGVQKRMVHVLSQLDANR